MSEIYDERAETERLSRVLLPYMVAGYTEGVETVRVRQRRDDFDDLVRDALWLKSFTHAGLAIGTTKDKLQKLLLQAIDEGWGVPDLGRRIRKLFDVDSRVRSLRIARTELTDVINDGSHRTLRAEGYRQKEWSTVIDGLQRPDHNAANGQVVGIDDFFRVGGEAARYPGDDTLTARQKVNCRCAIVGAGMTEDRKRQVGLRFLRVHGALERGLVVHLRRSFHAQRDRILAQFPSA